MTWETRLALMCFVAITIQFPLESVAQTTTTPYLAPTGFSLSSATKTVVVNGQTVPQEYGATVPGSSANWEIGQPQGKSPVANSDLPSLAQISGTNQWVAQNEYSYVNVNLRSSPDLPIITLGQDASLMPCSHSDGSPYEADLTPTPNPWAESDVDYPTAFDTAYYPGQSSFPTLVKLIGLTAAGTYTYIQSLADHKGPLACPINQASGYIQLILVDTAGSPAQILWYGLQLTLVCEPPKSGVDQTDYQSCLNQQANPAPVLFWNALSSPGLTTFGYGDVLTSYHLSPIQDNSAHKLNLNFLPVVEALIQNTYFSMDHNLSHWRLSSFNFGQSIWGGTYLSTSWVNFVPKFILGS